LPRASALDSAVNFIMYSRFTRLYPIRAYIQLISPLNASGSASPQAILKDHWRRWLPAVPRPPCPAAGMLRVITSCARALRAEGAIRSSRAKTERRTVLTSPSTGRAYSLLRPLCASKPGVELYEAAATLDTSRTQQSCMLPQRLVVKVREGPPRE
jgi:hypothetical protein